jgi:hypothetical protein
VLRPAPRDWETGTMTGTAPSHVVVTVLGVRVPYPITNSCFGSGTPTHGGPTGPGFILKALLRLFDCVLFYH